MCPEPVLTMWLWRSLPASPCLSFFIKWHSNSTCLTALLGINHHVWTFWSLRISRQVSGWLEVYQVLKWEWGLEKRRENTKPSSQEKSLKGQSTAWEQGRGQMSFAGRVLPVGEGRRGVQAVEGRGIRRETIRLEVFFFLIYLFFKISWRLITLQYCSGFCHTLTWISLGYTCIPYPEPPSHLPLHPIPPGLPSAPGPSTCLIHPTWAGDLFHPRSQKYTSNSSGWRY